MHMFRKCRLEAASWHPGGEGSDSYGLGGDGVTWFGKQPYDLSLLAGTTGDEEEVVSSGVAIPVRVT